jgi:peptide/nickel transport system ATP-binding protein
MNTKLLSIRDLCVDYITDQGPVRAVDAVSLDIYRGEFIGIAGESGCGKSTMAQALMRILPPPAIISRGEALFGGRDLFSIGEEELRKLRWKCISMVFQSAMDALNPVLSVGEQITDTMLAHNAANAREARQRAIELLEMVGIPGDRVDSFAHQLSGGMRQRVCIALAMALEPSLVILDEPTTALDVIVEHSILKEIRRLQRMFNFSVLFITHNLARMLQFSDRVAIFYAAKLVEIGPSAELREAPKHPYTQGLLRSFPSVRGSTEELSSIPGSPPSLRTPPAGCRFHPRCGLAVDICRERSPELMLYGGDHSAACHLAK